MSTKSKIEWTEITWNFITGCTKISEGCLNCYIERTPPFRIEHRKFDQPGIGGKTGVKLHSDRLHWPLTKWKKPSRIFVNSLADIFHEDVPDQFIAEGFAVMSIASHHTFQVLTKRHARMKSLLNSETFRPMVDAARVARGLPAVPGDGPVVLDNVWIGVSVESQKWADIRIPALLDTPAAVRWLSCEPLLGPINLFSDEQDGCDSIGIGWNHIGHSWLSDYGTEYDCEHTPGIDWVVGGGESGHGARPMRLDWTRSLREQCEAAGVPYFHKQNGQFALVLGEPRHGDVWVNPDGTTRPWEHDDGRMRRGGEPWYFGGSVLMRRMRGKHDAGRELDGRTHDEYPLAVSA